jgi:aerobic carbon-monoxide dehydrogenase medium subunit
MLPFSLLRPTSLAEASQLLLEHGDDARPLAGGTALQIFRHLGLLRLPYLVDLAGIPCLTGISLEDGWLVIGAMTPLRDVEHSPLVRRHVPALAETYARVANVRIRTTATAGGNLAHGDYRLDPPAILLPLGARVRINGPTGDRVLPLAEFFTGIEETALQPGDLLTHIRVPLADVPDRAIFRKFSSLAANDWPCYGGGICLWLDQGGRCRQAKAGISAMAPTPLLFDLPMLAGQSVDEALAREAGAYVAERVDPIADLRGSVAYKRRIAAVCTADAITAASSSPTAVEQAR